MMHSHAFSGRLIMILMFGDNFDQWQVILKNGKWIDFQLFCHFALGLVNIPTAKGYFPLLVLFTDQWQKQ